MGSFSNHDLRLAEQLSTRRTTRMCSAFGTYAMPLPEARAAHPHSSTDNLRRYSFVSGWFAPSISNACCSALRGSLSL